MSSNNVNVIIQMYCDVDSESSFTARSMCAAEATPRSIFVPNLLLQRGVFLFQTVFYSAEYVCGGSYTAAPGGITSPFYPDSYTSSQTCIYDIGCLLFMFVSDKVLKFFCNLLCLLQHIRSFYRKV
jgi:hypothetical protein